MFFVPEPRGSEFASENLKSVVGHSFCEQRHQSKSFGCDSTASAAHLVRNYAAYSLDWRGKKLANGLLFGCLAVFCESAGPVKFFRVKKKGPVRPACVSRVVTHRDRPCAYPQHELTTGNLKLRAAVPGGECDFAHRPGSEFDSVKAQAGPATLGRGLGCGRDSKSFSSSSGRTGRW